MKKLLLIAVLMLALVLTVAACKTEPTTNETTAGETTAAPAPAETTAEPADETTAAAPEETTVAPVETTEAPVETTEAPAPETTEEPEPETTADPMDPVNVFEAADITTVVGGDPSNLTQDCVTLEDNFLHIVPIGPDPYYYPFAGVDGARFVAIRYKTDATGADIQMYIGSTGGGPSDDSSMLRQPVIADGEWHLAIFDTQSLIDAGIFNGSYVSYFRFDALEAGYKLDENGQPYKNEDGTWARYTLPEGCSIDVEYIAFFQSAEAAEKYDYDRQTAPIAFGDAAFVAERVGVASNMINAADVVTEFGVSYVRLTSKGGDPFVELFSGLNANTNYLAISYRTNSTTEGQFFCGSGGGATGAGDNFNVVWSTNGWSLMIIDLSQTTLTSITDGIVNFLRLDFFVNEGAEGDYFDVEYIGFFKSEEAAQNYYNDNHAKYVTPDEAGKVANSFDTFFWNDEMYFEADGGAGDKLTAQNNIVAFKADQEVLSISLRGWIGFNQPIDSFGYFIDGGEFVFGEFKQDTEAGVLAAGGENASRFKIDADLTGLSRGEHKVGFIVKLANGGVVLLRDQITVVIPTTYDNYNVPQDQWTITGHNTALNGADNGMVAAGGVESAALLHQGSIYVGDIDLSKYSKVVIMWGCDNSQVTIDHYNASANNRWMLLNAVMDNVMSPEESTIIASTGYELMGWAVTAIEIDLTGIDYNGPVYVAVDALPGTFALVSSVEFIGGDIPEEEDAPVAGNEIAVTTTDNYGYFDEYTFTATGTGAYTFTLPAGLGLVTSEAYENWGAPVIDFYDNAEGYTFTVELAEGAEYKFLVGSTAKQDWVITYEFAEGEIGGDEPSDDPVVPTDKVLNLGENTVVVTDADLAEGAITYTFTVTEAGLYSFQSNSLMAVIVIDELTSWRGQAYLEAGTYTINVVVVYAGFAGEYGMNVVLEVPEEAGLEVDTPYYLEGVNAAGALYFAGTVTNGRADGCADTATATMVSLEATDVAGEYYIYFLVDGNKNYLIAKENKAAGLAISAEKTDAGIWVIDETAKTIISKAYPNRGLATQIGSTYNNFSFYAVSNFENTAEYKTSWFLVA